ncbi:MAG: GNAT family N-acetyltransferase [Pseudomonadales bacterium]|jgi:GNAT superfamily N-acetyltransferase|nr:GNAT family N-acetyltransferase [Pseudomonadales bacterium]
MTSVLIRSFLPSEWTLYRDTRLAALHDAPDAFGSTFAQNRTYDDAVWRARLEGLDPKADNPLLALVDDAVGGMAWITIKAERPDTAQLFQMWVAPEHRGRGVGRGLLAAAIDWARLNGARTVELGVTVGASPARRLYESAGFRPTHETEPLREGSALRMQPMALTLADGTRGAPGVNPDE